MGMTVSNEARFVFKGYCALLNVNASRPDELGHAGSRFQSRSVRMRAKKVENLTAGARKDTAATLPEINGSGAENIPG